MHSLSSPPKGARSQPLSPLVIPGQAPHRRRCPHLSSPAEHCVSNARGRGPRYQPPIGRDHLGPLSEILLDDAPQKHEITSALKHLAKISQSIGNDSGIDWDDDERKIDISDPYLRFYLRWKVRPLSQLEGVGGRLVSGNWQRFFQLGKHSPGKIVILQPRQPSDKPDKKS
jgi:hypothetical protein